MKLDRDSVIAALLHDVPEDTDVKIEQVHEVFGEKVAKLVDGVTKLGKIKWEGSAVPAGVPLPCRTSLSEFFN